MKSLLFSIVAGLSLFVAGQATLQAQTPPTGKASVTECYQKILKEIEDRFIGGVPAGWEELKAQTPRDFADLQLLVGQALEKCGNPDLKVIPISEAAARIATRDGGHPGIGITLSKAPVVTDGVQITDVSVDSPAEEAGLKKGDVLYAVDGRRITGWSLTAVTEYLKGEPNSTVAITVRRGRLLENIAVDRDVTGQPGITLDTTGNQLAYVVQAVNDGSPAAKAGIQAGDIIKTIDGANIAEIALSEEPTTRIVNRPIGAPIDLVLSRQGKQESRNVVLGVVGDGESRLLSGRSTNGNSHGWFYVKTNNLDWYGLVPALDAELTTNKDLPLLIVDLRGAAGTDPDIAAQLLSRFVQSAKPLVGAQRKVPGMQPYPFLYVGSPAPSPYAGKLVVLVDQDTAGTAELVASVLQSSGRAKVRGTPTSGSFVIPSYFEVQTTDGDCLAIAIPSGRLFSTSQETLKALRPDRTDHGRRNENLFHDEVVRNVLDEVNPNSFGSTIFLCLLVFLLFCLLAIGLALYLGAQFAFERWLKNKRPPLYVAVIFLGALVLTAALAGRYAGPPKPQTSEVVVQVFIDESPLGKAQEKAVQKLVSEYSGSIRFEIVNVTKTPVADLNHVPTVRVGLHAFAADGTEVGSSVQGSGVRTRAQIVEAIESAQSNARSMRLPVPNITRAKQTP